MKKKIDPLTVPCLVVCALAFLDADYVNLSVLGILSLVFAALCVIMIARHWFRTKSHTP
jgi:hypothetical protein